MGEKELIEEKEKGKTSSGISRREFLKDAGLVVGGATVGSMALVNACNGSTTTVTTGAATVTNNVTKTVTTTVSGPGGSTVTVTGAPATGGAFTDPVDGTTYSSLDALKAHFNAVHPHGDASIVAFTVNGTLYTFAVKPQWSLAHVLREGLGLWALKEGCERGECGTCTVIMDGLAVHSCMILACEMEGHKVTTVEGLSNGGTLGPIQQKFYNMEAQQCGFCTPGFLMAAQALIAVNAKPTQADVQLAFSGHVCMCGNLHRHINATVGGV